jgi:capsular polysaccharide biosynthesis protein
MRLRLSSASQPSMFAPHTSHILKKHRRLIVVTGLLVGLASVLVSLFFPLDYRADAQVLLLSQSRYGVDPYTVVRSAERVGENISHVMETQDFFSKVIAHDQSLDTRRFQNVSDRVRRKRWQRTIDASMVFGTGVMNVSAYHTDPAQATRYATAAAQTLVDQGWEYAPGDMTMKIVNQAVVTRWPVRPNILLNLIVGFVVGVLVMGVSLIYRARARH